MRRNTNTWDNYQERAFLENQLDRRIQFFLFFIVLSIVVALLIPSKEIAVMLLILFVITSWLLVVSIYYSSSKLKNVEKEIGKDFSLKDKLIRFLYTIVLPIFTALLLTFFLLLIVSGTIDSILPYKQKVIETSKETVKKVEEVVDKKVKSPKNDPNYFKSVDSVISDSRSNYVVIDTSLTKVEQQNKNNKKQITKKPKVDPNFKSIEKIINE
ncbi:MAG: hypothetical protein N2321_00720 [Melioribacteraceae bacterium]|nr:hypothetical protein [Melioribacteraceae bacterium]